MKIAMISDFFAPRLGGVENHILNLSKELHKLGHTIIIITNSTSGVCGIHYVSGFKTYYLNLFSLFSGSIFPTIICSAGPIVSILLEEKVDIVHSHQCSTLPIEGILHSKILGIPTCFTNHSLVKVQSLGGIVTETMFQLGVRTADRIICVSEASKENTAERLDISRNRITVIPNAVTEEFKPNEIQEDADTYRRSNHKKCMEKKECTEEEIAQENNVNVQCPMKNAISSQYDLDKFHRIIQIRKECGWVSGEIVIAVVSRLTRRKGADLLASLLPSICKIDDRVRVLIAGDGDKKELLEHTVEKHKLKEKVKFLGGVHPSIVNSVLNQSDLFLNTSLTDAFCISIIEAAACGLYVVSTDVDGISEVLPKDMVTLVPPVFHGILRGIESALPRIRTYDKVVSHRRVHSMYKWSLVASKTDQVYRSISHRKETAALQRVWDSLQEMYSRQCARVSIIFSGLLLVNYVIIFTLAFFYESRKRHTKV
ncbi:phosphatidylinositol N-acetylglucosaminyltransferase subunit A [Nematocida ausubeli]|nr:phosphatidylinositol N-acetylglucosaminyltransferase subunit A [Nematocida ausubeli]